MDAATLPTLCLVVDPAFTNAVSVVGRNNIIGLLCWGNSAIPSFFAAGVLQPGVLT